MVRGDTQGQPGSGAGPLLRTDLLDCGAPKYKGSSQNEFILTFFQQTEEQNHLGLENILFHPEKNLSLHFQSPKILGFGKNEGELEVAHCSKWRCGKGRLQILRAGFVPKDDWYKLTRFAKYSS